MALLFIDSFDHYTTATMKIQKWDSIGNGFTINNIGPRTGTGCLNLGGTTPAGPAWCTYIFGNTATSSTFVVAGFAIKFSATLDHQFCTLGYWPTNSTQAVTTLFISLKSGTLRVGTGNQVILRNGSTFIIPGVWYYMELSATIGGSGSFTLKLNGSVEIQSGTVNTAQSVGGVDRLSLGSDTDLTGTGGGDNWDDLYILDSVSSTVGVPNNTFLGPITVTNLLPTNNGDVHWAPSTNYINDPYFSYLYVGNDFALPGRNANTGANIANSPVWIFNGGGIAGNGSGYTNANPNSPFGTQVALLQGANCSISQVIPWMSAGNYRLSLYAANRANYNAQDFQIKMDGNNIGAAVTPSSTSYTLYTTAQFTVTAGTHTLSFTGLNSGGGDRTAFICNVALSSITNNFQNINEIAPDFDVSYNYILGNQTSQSEVYLLSGSAASAQLASAATTTVFAVQANTIIRKTPLGTGVTQGGLQLKVVTSSNTTAAIIYPTDVYTNISTIMNTDPYTTQAWTPSTLDTAFQMGVST